MASLTETFSSRQENHLRAFDPINDLGPVADLVELCFIDTLDPEGREYLARMRSAARSARWLSWAARAEWTQPAMNGYVWHQDGRIIGNASLIPYFVNTRRFFLVANVAVHPDYRRQGIARKLTLQSIEHARRRGAASVWLHVREENRAAFDLYQDLHFVERARRTSWFSSPDFDPAPLQAGERIAEPPGTCWQQMRPWFQNNYPPELSWHLPFRIRSLNPGVLGELYRFLFSTPIRQWALFNHNRLACSLAWQPLSHHSSSLWLAAPADAGARHIQALLSNARAQIRSTRSLVLDYPAHRHEAAIRDAGFAPSQTLIWMELKLANQLRS